MAYLPLYFPSKAKFHAALDSALEGGANALEIGIPFSDPIADGPVIQQASRIALVNGANVREFFRAMEIFRKHHHVPVAVMSYANPVLQFGIDRFFRECNFHGIDAVVVADMIPEESFGKKLAYLISSTCSSERLPLIARKSFPFVYVVSVTGTTGMRTTLPRTLPDFVARVKKHSKVPVYVGFGISRRAQAKWVLNFADGAIVGSYLVRTLLERKDAARSMARLFG